MKTTLLHPLSRRLAAGVLSILTLIAPARASDLLEWWDGPSASGDWLGVRPPLEEQGIVFSGDWKGTFYGVVNGGLRQQGAFDEELHFKLKVDFEKLAGLTGLSASAGVRWRDGANPNDDVGASAAFNPSNTQVGKQWRLMPLTIQWESRDLLPVRDMVTVAGGWTNPYFSFIQQPDSRLFVNNAIHQTKGLVNSGFPWSGSYNTWGGHLKLKPAEWAYVQAGLYTAIPGALNSANHGLYFEGALPARLNGLYAIGEAGVTPRLGPSELPGKYAMGGIFYGLENTSFNGTASDGRSVLYGQADQMLFRESSALPEPAVQGAPEGKATAKSTSTARRAAGDQGLTAFTFFSFAPAYNNAMPFYFHAGLVSRGLIPGRDRDQIGVAFAYGNYSIAKLHADERAGRSQQSFEAVLEGDYRFQVNRFAYVQPYLQYIIRPNGTGAVANATVLGIQMGVTF